MTLKLLPDQVPKYWSLIKYGYLKTTSIPDNMIEKASRYLLVDLLSEKSQCWFQIRDEQIITMAITKLKISDIDGTLQLYINNLFSYTPMTELEMKEGLKEFITFAKNIGCVSITAQTMNDALVNVAKKFNFIQLYKSLSLRIGGIENE